MVVGRVGRRRGRVTFARTVLGDIPTAELGVTYAHEHLVIDGGRPVELSPDFLLADVGKMAVEVREAMAAGLRTAVDAMPADCGRNAVEARRAEPVDRTQRHRPDRTPPRAVLWAVPLEHASRTDALADLFAADVTDGIDANDYARPTSERTDVRAGVVKIAGSEGGPSSARRRRSSPPPPRPTGGRVSRS